jgi:hypothetical protein
MKGLNQMATTKREKDDSMSCGKCFYFTRFTKGNDTLGECHANAPIIWHAATRIDYESQQPVATRFGQFPVVPDDNFCGEFLEAKDN